MYSAKESVYKQETREHLYNIVIDHLGAPSSEMNFLTFPNLNLSLEEKLLEKYPNSWINAYEMHELTYKKLKKLINNPRILPIYGDIFECERVEDYEPHDKLSFVWLDFCNSYCDNFLEKLIQLIADIDFENKAILSVTLNKRRGTASENLYYNNFYPNYKDEGFALHIADVIGRQNIQEIERMTYICKDISIYCGCMNVFTFLINKTNQND